MDLKVDDSTGDLVLVNGDLVLVERGEAVKQSVRQNLRMFRGEWFLDLDEGTPWFQDILIKSPRIELVEGIIKARIIQTPGVIELTSFVAEYDNTNRRMSAKFDLIAFNERLDFEEILGIPVREVTP